MLYLGFELSGGHTDRSCLHVCTVARQVLFYSVSNLYALHSATTKAPLTFSPSAELVIWVSQHLAKRNQSVHNYKQKQQFNGI